MNATPVYGLLMNVRAFKCSVCGHTQSLQTNHTGDVHVRCDGCSWKGAGFDKSRTDIPTKGLALGHTNRRFVYVGQPPTDFNPFAR